MSAAPVAPRRPDTREVSVASSLLGGLGTVALGATRLRIGARLEHALACGLYRSSMCTLQSMSLLLRGACACVDAPAGLLRTGAGVAGGMHHLATAKALREEGIDATARLRALPVAVQLAACFICPGLGSGCSSQQPMA